MLGLEEGSLPRRSARLAVPRRRRRRELGGRLERPDQVSRDRYLFYTACTRATRRLYLVREAATDDGAPREPSPFWDEVAAVFDAEDVDARDRAPAALGAHLAARGRADRARARSRARAALASASSTRPARSPTQTTGSAGSTRARGAFQRETQLDEPGAARDGSARRRRSASPSSSAIADCSSAWLLRAHRLAEDDRRRGRPDAARVGRPQRSAQVLRRAAEGARPRPRDAGEPRAARVGFLRRCLDDALRGGVRLELTDLQEAELDESLWRDLEGVRARRGGVAAAAPAPPLRGVFGSDRSAPELQRGLHLGDEPLPEREDRPHRRRPVQRARDRAGLQVGPDRALGEADRRGAEAPDPALHARVARPRRHRAARRRLPRARRRARYARPAARGAAEDLPGYQRKATTSPRSEFWSLVETARDARARLRDAHPRRRRPARPEGRRRAPPGATSGRCAGWSAP